jgi:hypothetical protein
MNSDVIEIGKAQEVILGEKPDLGNDEIQPRLPENDLDD